MSRVAAVPVWAAEPHLRRSLSANLRPFFASPLAFPFANKAVRPFGASEYLMPVCRMAHANNASQGPPKGGL